jgi:hypothetical protein
MAVDIDNIVYEMVEALDFEEMVWLARKLEVEADPESWCKDEFEHRGQQVKEELEDALRKTIEGCSEGRALRLAEKMVNTEDVLMHQEGLILCPFCLHEIHLSPYHEPDCEYRDMLIVASEIIEASKEK